jgi:O-antigen/teichoic acid export membrane protein
MSTTRAVARGTSRLLAGLLTAKALDFAFYLLLARRLGVAEFGRYTYSISFTLLFTVIADFGILTIFTREAARTPGRVRVLLAQVIPVKLGLAAATLAGTLGVSWAMREPREILLLVSIATLAMLINSVAFLFENLLKSSGRAGIAGGSAVAQSATAIALGAVLLFSGLGAVAGALAYLAASLVHLVAAAAWSRDLWSRRAQTPGAISPWNGPAALLWDAAPLALSGAFIVLYFRADSVLLNIIHGPQATGLYGSVYRFFEAFVMLSAAYRSVLFPVMARAADGPAESLGVLCRKSLRLHLMFTVGVAVFFTFQARAIVQVLLGPAYAEAAPALAILMWSLPCAFMADTVLHLLAAQRRQSVSARAITVTALFNIAANLIAIPRLSIVGAAITTVLSEALCFTLLFLAFSRSVPTVSLVTVARAPLFAGAFAASAMVLLARLSPGGVVGLILMATFAISAYLLALVALGALGRQDAELVSEMLPRALRPLLPGERRGAREARS